MDGKKQKVFITLNVLTLRRCKLVNETLLFTPGPVNVPFYFRDKKFPKMVLYIENQLKKAVGCKDGRAVLYTCSGTGALDAVATNLLSDKDKVLVIVGGGFGKRWYDICKFYDKNVIPFYVPFGKDINMQELEDTISSNNINVILSQHHETNSGQLHNVEAIGNIARRYNALFIVDAISSFLTDKFYMDKWNIGGCIISTQKGMRLDPGVAFLILNNRLIEHSKTVKKLNYYNNLDTYLSDYCLTRGHTPFTPPVNLVFDIWKFFWLSDVSVLNRIRAQKQLAERFRQALKELRLPLVMVSETPSNFLTALMIVNDKYSAVDLYNHLKKKNMFVSKVGQAHSPFMIDAEKRLFLVSHIGCDWTEHQKLLNEMRLFFDKRNKNKSSNRLNF